MNHLTTNANATVNVSRTPRPRPARARLRLLGAIPMLTIGLVTGEASLAQAKARAVPFKSAVSGTVTMADPVFFVLEGSGTSSHLGATSYRADGVIETIDPVTGAITDSLTETLTAASGDTLTIYCEQSGELLSPGVYHGTDRWTVIGGTGRFSDATGSGTGDTYVDLNEETFSKQLTGSITK